MNGPPGFTAGKKPRKNTPEQIFIPLQLFSFPAANLAGTRKKPQTPTDCAPEWSATVQFASKKTITVRNHNRLTNCNTAQLYLSSPTEKSDHMLNPFSN
ncbi:hypothetical protein [Pseudomonas sp. C9-3]|uniref:hypothetical protein n=1 Tax=Pseudomonas sp. C9-3 TaxID=3078264 RepID=UPI0028F0A140|nr:hypothetical protein [Pseudomonas sp. C9-3]